VLAIILATSHLNCADEPSRDDSLYDGKTLKQWIKELDDPDKKTRLWAIMTLAEIGPDAHQAVVPLMERFKDKEERLQYKASEAVAKIRTRAIPSLIKGLGNDDARVRRWSAHALSEMRDAGKEAIPALIETLQDQDSAVRAMAVAALGAMGPSAKAAIPAATKLIRDNRVVRRSAAVALWYIDHQADTTLAPLIEAIHDEDIDLADRLECIQVLASMGPKGERAAGSLLEFGLEDRRQEIRIASAKALVQIGPKAVRSLTRALTRPESRKTAIQILGDIGPGAQEAITPLVRLILDKKTGNDDRRAAGDALVRIGKEAVEGMLRLLRDDDPDLRELAAVLLGRMGEWGKAAVTPLTRALNDDEASVRQAAAEALKRIDPDAAAKAGIR
jgi:HEAT repeat protein